MPLVRGLVIAVLACGAGAAVAQAPSDGADPFASLRGKLTKSPGLFAISASGTMAGVNGLRMCQGGPAAGQMADVLRAMDPATVAELSKGCTRKVERPAPDRITFDQICEKAAGAAISMRMVISMTPTGFEQRMEFDGPDGSGRQVASTTATYLGECPAGMKPGDYMEPDGTIRNPLAELDRLSKDITKSAKDAGSPK